MPGPLQIEHLHPTPLAKFLPARNLMQLIHSGEDSAPSFKAKTSSHVGFVPTLSGLRILIIMNSSRLRIESRPTISQLNLSIYSNKVRIEELVFRRPVSTFGKDPLIPPSPTITSSNRDRILDFLRRNATFSWRTSFGRKSRMNEPPTECR